MQSDPAHPTGRVIASVVDGQNQFEIAPDQAWDFIRSGPAIRVAAEEPVGLLYHGTLALRGEQSWSTLRSLAGKIDAPSFVDINLREPWWTPEKLDW